MYLYIIGRVIIKSLKKFISHKPEKHHTVYKFGIATQTNLPRNIPSSLTHVRN